MKAIYKRFNSMQELKERGESFKKGQIIPRRILACDNKKEQHLWTFGANCVAIPTPSGYLIHVENNDGEFSCAVRVKGKGGFVLTYGCRSQSQCYSCSGSIYGGETSLLGNIDLDQIETLSRFNDSFMDKCKQ